MSVTSGTTSGAELQEDTSSIPSATVQQDDSDRLADRLSVLLRRKRVLKTNLTKARLVLTALLCSDDVSSAEFIDSVRSAVRQVLRFQEEVIDNLLLLCDVDSDRFESELDTIQNDSAIIDILSKSTDFLSNLSKTPPNSAGVIDDPGADQIDPSPNPPSSSDSNSDVLSTYQVDKDMFQQLKRVTIPKFNGNKKDYQLFKDAFYQCIDKAKCTDGYKMLQLRQYLEGEALKAIEGFPATTVGYVSAKNRLEEKFGGSRRIILLHLDAIRHMKPILFHELKSIESFCDKLELSIIALKEAGRSEEFDENSMFYCVAKSKLSPANIANYKRWAATVSCDETLLTLHKWLSTELRYRIEAQEEVEGFGRSNPSYSQRPKSYPSSTSSSNSRAYFDKSRYPTNELSCALCESNHNLWDCQSFRTVPVNRRWEIAKDKRVCFRCLGEAHRGRDCKNVRKCSVENCARTHHPLLHGGEYPGFDRDTRDSRNLPGRPFARTHAVNNHDSVAMRVVPVILENGNRRVQVNALLDECSTDSFIDDNVAFELGLRGTLTDLNVGVLGGKKTSLNTSLVSLCLHSIDYRNNFKLDAFTVNNVTGDLNIVDWNKYSYNWPHLNNIQFPKVEGSHRVDLLLGLNVPELHHCITEIYGRPGEPIARLTPLGWTCIGPYESLENRSLNANHFARTFFVQPQSDTNSLLRKMWELESMGVASSALPSVSVEDSNIDTFVKSTLKCIDNRYEIGLPWKSDEPKLNNNYEMARSRLFNLEKSLSQPPSVSAEYCKVIKEHIDKNYVKEIVPSEKHSDSVWFLPHFPIVRFDKSTTKVRLVMDAAARWNGKSLNDCIFQGPKLQRELIDVLIRFRINHIALAADITEMFLQVRMTAEDKRYHRFLWRDMDVNSPIREFEYQRLVFGNTASPYLSQTVIREHAKSNVDQFPNGAESVLNSMYVDDLLDSVDSVESAIALRREISDLLLTAGFHIRKWLSNDPRVLEDIAVKDRVTCLSLDDGNLPALKTLGLLWNANSDKFTFHVEQPPNAILTKRFVVSKVASLFDPLNLLSPYTVRAKIGIQLSWVQGTDWDEELPSDLCRRWKIWFSELSDLALIDIQRCIMGDQSTSTVIDKSLHTFADASEKAYAACTYLRCVYSDGRISVQLIASKTRVAPLKTISIPKLELCGAILGLRLTETICNVLNIQTGSVIYWCDSQNVLFWITGESRTYKPFVSHRVGEIHEKSDPVQWRYVPTKMNSADLSTRGISAVELSRCTLWWNGPEFLKDDPSCWPVSRHVEPVEAQNELRNNRISNTFAIVPLADMDRLCPSRFSKWLRLIRITAWILRFVNNIRYKTKLRDSTLLVGELLKAENFWFKRAQFEYFQSDISVLRKNKSISNNSKLLQLNPCLDDDGLLRVNGRLEKAELLSYNARFPIILPSKHDVTRLVVMDAHESGNHEIGVSHTLGELRARFWILRARETVKGIQAKCNECIRRRRKPANQIMAPLPKIRLGSPLKAFARVGVDYGGPYLTKQGRGRIRTKRYLCLFTCLASRAVHLEMAWSLDTDSFLSALDRFVNRRSKPLLVLSDNGSNFVSANRELKDLLLELDQDKIGNSLSNRGIEWQFNPPTAPHFGGVFESLIKSSKRAIKAVLGNADICDEELLTAIVSAEGLLNSRPLCYIGDSVEDDPVLTPNHFLFGQLGGSLAPEIVDELRFNPRRRWRRVQDLVKQFWRRWMREFLPHLNSRKKWNISSKNIEIGNVVLIVDPQTPRGKWPLGRVTKTFPGSDGFVRVVELKCGDSVLTRPIHRLCPLEA